MGVDVFHNSFKAVGRGVKIKGYRADTVVAVGLFLVVKMEIDRALFQPVGIGHHGLGRAQGLRGVAHALLALGLGELGKARALAVDAVYLPDERGSHGVQLVLVAAAIVVANIVVGRELAARYAILVFLAVQIDLGRDVLRPAGRLNPVKAVLGHNVELVACIEILVGRKGYLEFLDLDRSRLAVFSHSNVEGVVAVGVLEIDAADRDLELRGGTSPALPPRTISMVYSWVSLPSKVTVPS